MLDMSNPYGPPGQPPGYGPPGGYGGPPGGQGGSPGGYGGPPGGQGGPPGGYGGPPGGYGGPPGYGPPGQGGFPQGPRPESPPEWVGWVARGFLALGILLAIATLVGGMSSESLGVTLAQVTGAPLGFGIVATVLTQKTSTGGAGKPLGLGCLTGFVLSLSILIFFSAIWPSL